MFGMETHRSHMQDKNGIVLVSFTLEAIGFYEPHSDCVTAITRPGIALGVYHVTRSALRGSSSGDEHLAPFGAKLNLTELL